MQVWILTFNRPDALNRLIKHFGEQGQQVNILSNYPIVQIYSENMGYYPKVVVNTLSDEKSTSWCARSWNSIFLKAFQNDDELICIQDDTDITPDFMTWINEQKQKFDFIWGPAGDQFFYLTKDVLRTVGWFDERFIGCYCGDAEFMKRAWTLYDRSKVSVEDTHNWGFQWNACGIVQHVITTYQSKTIDPTYDNQHWDLERRNKENPTLKASQDHFEKKWGVTLDNNRPVIDSYSRRMPEIDWYPWASQLFDINRKDFDYDWL